MRRLRCITANTTRIVNGKRIGSKQGASKGKSKGSLTNLLEEHMLLDKDQQQMVEEAIIQTSNKTKPSQITQDDEPIETPM